jgi:single-strand DNA-binding protein
MKVFGLARIGRDFEVRSAGGESVGDLSLAFPRRVKGEKVTDWVEATLWGKRCDALAPYLKKGGLVAVTLDDLHIKTYQGKNGEGHKLAARVIDIELAGGNDKQDTASYQTTRQAVPGLRQAPPDSDRFVDSDDDIPF